MSKRLSSINWCYHHWSVPLDCGRHRPTFAPRHGYHQDEVRSERKPTRKPEDSKKKKTFAPPPDLHHFFLFHASRHLLVSSPGLICTPLKQHVFVWNLMYDFSYVAIVCCQLFSRQERLCRTPRSEYDKTNNLVVVSGLKKTIQIPSDAGDFILQRPEQHGQECACARRC